MTSEAWTLAGIIAAGLLGLAGVIYTGTSARRSTASQTAQVFAGNLLGRLDNLEEQMGELQEKLRALDHVIRAFSNFVDRLGTWLEYGQHNGKPMPTPPKEIHGYIDTSAWVANHEEDERRSEGRS